MRNLFASVDPRVLIWESLIHTRPVYLQQRSLAAIGTLRVGVEALPP